MAAPSTSNPLIHGYRRPWLYDAQREAFFCHERYAICEASTKSGKTIGCMAWLVEQAMVLGRPGRNYWWLAPVYTQAEIAYNRIRRGLDRRIVTPNHSKLTLTLANGAILRFLSAEKP